MSTSTQHPQRPYHDSDSRTSDVRGNKAPSLATFLTQDAAPHLPHRGYVISQDTSRHYGMQPEPRNDPQSQDRYHHLEGSYRRHDSSSHISHQQLVVEVSRRYSGNPPQSSEPSDSQDSQHISHQRHPSLSLDTRNLPNSHPSPFTPSRPAADSPSFLSSESISPLHADLNSLKSGLESLWNLSSKKLHNLHSARTTQADSLRSLSVTNAKLESTITQQQAALSREIERLNRENTRLVKVAREADESCTKALREREILGDANTQLWEDKARLEGEKRELKVKLDAETDFARLCQRELEKEKEKEKESQTSQRVKVKREDDEDHRNDGLGEIRIPLVHVEELIERRLQYQANEFTRGAKELYVKLAQSQTHITELEAQLKRYSAGANSSGTGPPVPPHSSSRSSEKRPEKHSPVLTPVTPHTALLSSVSENDREYPFGKAWNSKKIEPNYRLSGISMIHGDNRPTPPVDSRGVHSIQRTAYGHLESKSTERDIPPRRESLPTQITKSVSYSNSPLMDPVRGEKRVAPEPSADVHGQVVSTYAGVETGWRPAPPPSTKSSRSQRSASHSSPATPDRPFKKSRTADAQDARSQEGSSKPPVDVDMVSNNGGNLSGSAETIQPPVELEHSGRELKGDERLMFNSLNRVLVKKRDNDGWKCVLCRKEKKSPTAIFSETTPIGVVTLHVKGIHREFWKNLRGEGEQTVTSGS